MKKLILTLLQGACLQFFKYFKIIFPIGAILLGVVSAKGECRTTLLNGKYNNQETQIGFWVDTREYSDFCLIKIYNSHPRYSEYSLTVPKQDGCWEDGGTSNCVRNNGYIVDAKHPSNGFINTSFVIRITKDELSITRDEYVGTRKFLKVR